jgi:hypothetical protein
MRKRIKGFGYPVKRDDKNFKKYKRQRETRGFDDTELWGLDVAIAKFIAPRLKAYIAHKDGSVPQSALGEGVLGAMYSPGEGDDNDPAFVNIQREWNTKLHKMLDYFTFVAKEKETSDRVPNELKEGLKLFAEHYADLWD